MTTGGLPGFGYSDDSVAARLSIDVPANSVGTLKEIALYSAQIQQSMEAAARFTGDYVGYLNSFPTIQRQVLDLQREQLQTLRDTQAVMTSMRATGASGAGYMPSGPTTQYYGQQGVGMPSPMYPGGPRGTDRYQTGRETPAAQETSQNGFESDYERGREAAFRGNRIETARNRGTEPGARDSRGILINPRSIPDPSMYGQPYGMPEPQFFPGRGYGPGIGLPGSDGLRSGLVGPNGRPLPRSGSGLFEPIRPVPGAPFGPHQDPDRYSQQGLSDGSVEAAQRRLEEHERLRFESERAAQPGGGAPDTTVPPSPADPNAPEPQPRAPRAPRSGSNSNSRSGFGFDNFTQGVAQGFGQILGAGGPGSSPTGARLLTAANLLRNIGGSNTGIFAPRVAPTPEIPGVGGAPGTPATPGSPGGALGGLSPALRTAGGIGMGLAVAGLAANAVQGTGQAIQGFRNMDVRGEQTLNEGLGVQKDVMLMALNPLLSTEQSRSIIMGAMKSGYSGQSYDNAVDFIKGNLLEMNVEVGKSLEVLKTNVNMGKQSLESVKLDFNDIQTMSNGSAATNEQLVGSYTRLSDLFNNQLGGQGDGRAQKSIMNMFAGDPGSPDPLMENGQGEAFMAQALASPTITAEMVKRSGLGGDYLDIVNRMRKEMPEAIGPMVMDIFNDYSKGQGDRAQQMQILLSNQGVNLDLGSIQNLIDRSIPGRNDPSQKPAALAEERNRKAFDGQIGGVTFSELKGAGISTDQIARLGAGNKDSLFEGDYLKVRKEITDTLKNSGNEDLLNKIDWGAIEDPDGVDGAFGMGNEQSALSASSIERLASQGTGAVFAVDPEGNYYPITGEKGQNDPRVVANLLDPNSGWTFEKHNDAVSVMAAGWSMAEDEPISAEQSKYLSQMPRTPRTNDLLSSADFYATVTGDNTSDLVTPVNGKVEGEMVSGQTLGSGIQQQQSMLFGLTPEASRILQLAPMPGNVATDQNTLNSNSGANGATKNSGPGG